MIKEDCQNYEKEWTLELESVTIFDHTEDGARRHFDDVFETYQIGIKDAYETGGGQCLEDALIDGECPEDCPHYHR